MTRTARGIALFFGLFSFANGLAGIRGQGLVQNLWWVDLHFLGPALSSALLLGGTVALVAYALKPVMSPRRSAATAALCAALALAAIWNATGFYAAWHAGSIVPAVPLPFSAVIAAGFGFIAWRALVGRPAQPSRRDMLAVVAVAVVAALLMSLSQVFFFGTTDYRRAADVAVVFGAKANANGSLSTSLEDRVRTAADLYRAGLVPKLIMSGAVGASGVDETEAMRTRAIALGVPAEAIVLDHEGVDTDSTVRNTMAYFEDEPARRVLVVSQFYHLPRIKLAYAAVGRDVSTVPATASLPIVQTPKLVAREVAGFWVYWLRATARAVVRG